MTMRLRLVRIVTVVLVLFAAATSVMAAPAPKGSVKPLSPCNGSSGSARIQANYFSAWIQDGSGCTQTSITLTASNPSDASYTANYKITADSAGNSVITSGTLTWNTPTTLNTSSWTNHDVWIWWGIANCCATVTYTASWNIQ